MMNVVQLLQLILFCLTLQGSDMACQLTYSLGILIIEVTVSRKLLTSSWSSYRATVCICGTLFEGRVVWGHS